MKKSVFSGEYELDAGAAQSRMPAPGVPAALHVLHRGAARAGLRADREERGLSQGLQPGVAARSRARAAEHRAGARRPLFRSDAAPPVHARGAGLRAGASNAHIGGGKDVFALAPLDSRLFDDEATPLLNKVRFPEPVWQRVIRLMSESGVKGKRKGRVSYQLLSINQLGAVYEALLAYRGFFAAEDLYEVQPAPKKAAKSATTTTRTKTRRTATMTKSPSGRAPTCWTTPGSCRQPHRRVQAGGARPRRRRERAPKLRKYPKGTFIYRLAGRDREKSASYYTPQVLTRCLVKYALKELLQDKTADDILQLTVCEPAMGSAAFLNEAVNQLAEAYLERKQAELNRRIPHDEYPRELQRVRMVLADRNVFGVDLNPVAVELAEVSLWLNAIYGQPDKDADGNRCHRARPACRGSGISCSPATA